MRWRSFALLWLAWIAFRLILGADGLAAQNSSRRNPPKKTSAEKHNSQSNQAEVELQARMNRVRQATAAKDVAGVERGSEQVIALALRLLGQLRLLQASPLQAAELYQRSLAFEKLPDTRVDLAIAYLQADQTDQAIQAAEQALSEEPNNFRALNALGRAWMVKRDYAKAARALSRAEEISPDTESLYNLGIALLASNDPADKPRAAQAFEQMKSLAGDSGSLHVLFGRAYRDARDLPSAIRELRRAIEMDTRTPHAHYFLGLAYMAQNEWVATAETRAEFKKELEFYPRDYLANYMLGLVASSERNYEESDRYSKVAAAINPKAPDPWLYLGLNAYQRGDMKNAEIYFRKAILLTGEDNSRSNYQIRRAYADLGRILSSSGRKEEAESYLLKARDYQNKVLEANREGMAEHLLEEGVAASSPFMPPTVQKEKRISPDHELHPDVFAKADDASLSHSSLSDEQKKRADDQEKELREVLAQGFGDLATSEAVRKDYAAALAHYQESERWVSAQPLLQRSLGIAAFRAQNYSEAIRGLSAWLAKNPTDAPARAMLGMALFGLEKFEEAVNTFSPLGTAGMQDATVGYAWAASLARRGELKRAGEILSVYDKGTLAPETLLLVGQLWIEIGDYERAVTALHRAAEFDTALRKVHYFAGQADIRSEKWADAAQEFQEELALAPDDLDSKYNLGFVYLQLSKVEEAANLFREVIFARPDYANAHYQLGKILLDRGDAKGAIEHLEIAARLNPQSDFVHYQLQSAYRKESRIAEADREMELYKQLKTKQRDRAAAAISAVP